MTVIINESHLKIISIEVPNTDRLQSVNFFLVEKHDELFLIDAGYNDDTHWNHLTQALAEHNYTLNDLTAILLTHHHVDHVGLVHRISQTYQVPVYLHPEGIPKIKRDPEFLYMNYLFSKELFHHSGCGQLGAEQVDARYARQMSNPQSALDWNLTEIRSNQLFGFEVIELPGHALDQVGFYLPDEEIIFIGDLMINHLRTSAFIDPTILGNKTNALLQHKSSLQKIIDLNPKIALSGHGTVIEKPVALAKQRLAEIDEKAEKILNLIRDGVPTASQIAQQRHPRLYEKLFLIIISDVLSFTEYLEQKGATEKEIIDGIWHYHVN